MRNGKTSGKPSANMECPIICCGFCTVCSMAGQAGLNTTVLMEIWSAVCLGQYWGFFFLVRFSRRSSGRSSCFTGQLPGMCHLYTGGAGCAGKQGQVQATAPYVRAGTAGCWWEGGFGQHFTGERLVLQFVNYVSILPKERWVVRALNWLQQHARRVGRPAYTWDSMPQQFCRHKQETGDIMLTTLKSDEVEMYMWFVVPACKSQSFPYDD